MGKIISKSGQSLFDIALQAYGSIEGIFGLLADNAEKQFTLTDKPAPGTVLIVSGAALNKYIVDEYSNLKIIPATYPIQSVGMGGIGYWAVEVDFEIQ